VSAQRSARARAPDGPASAASWAEASTPKADTFVLAQSLCQRALWRLNQSVVPVSTPLRASIASKTILRTSDMNFAETGVITADGIGAAPS